MHHPLSCALRRCAPLALAFSFAVPSVAADNAGVLPRSPDGRSLNFDFETGDLRDWRAEGEAFKGQPIEGDTVSRRRSDMKSRHQGRFWIGTYEREGDGPQGVLTSVPFRVTHPYASFLVGGGSHVETCVEIVQAETGELLARFSGLNREDMTRVAVDLSGHLGEEIRIRVVDRHSGHWGHINFDDFRFHAERPELPVRRDLPPPSLDVYKYAGIPPEKAAEVMTVPEGFRVTLFAGEPEVEQPIAMAIDDRGRLWIAQSYSYPVRRPDSEARDRIVIFEDRDGDGRADARKVFIEGLNLLSGLEVGFGGVFAGAAPYLYFIPDRDGDDRPDGPPEVLLDGWGYQDTHETLNAFIWGPDGWLYGCHGVFTHSLVGPPGAPKEKRVPLNAAVWRYHPVKRRFEVFAHGTSNPWGVDFDDHGQAFITACVIPHLYHVIHGARYQRQAGRHFNPYTYDDIKTIADHLHYIGPTPHSGNNRSSSAGGGHAHCGAMIYLGNAWPEKYRGAIFTNNIHGQRINMDLLEPRGSGFTGRHGPDFLLTHDRWSQIVNLRYGPDGQVYMIDWYDNQACHTTDIRRVDRSNGRIFKVSYGSKRAGTVNLAALADRELVELQLHANDWYVRHARRLLQERAAARGLEPAVRERLHEIAFRHPDETRRLRGMWALHVTGGLTEAEMREALASPFPYVRAWAIELSLEDGVPPAGILERFVDLAARDPSPVVRLCLASAAGRLPADAEARWALVERLSQHGEDARDHNIPLMCWYALEPLAGRNPERALEIAARAKLPRLLEFTVRRIGEGGAKDKDAVALLVSALERIEGDGPRGTVLDGILRALKGVRRIAMPSSWPRVFERLSREAGPELRGKLFALAAKFSDPKAAEALRRAAANPGLPADVRRSAVGALLEIRDPELPDLLVKLLGEKELRRTALRALAAYDDPKIPDRILSVYGDLAPDERRDALYTLASRLSFARKLLDAVGGGIVPARDISADLARQLGNVADEELRARIEKTWGLVRKTPEEKARLIAEYKKKITAPGPAPDLSLGRAVFARVCQQCHTLFGKGGRVGPDLTGSNRADLDYLLSNVIDPSAVLAREYQPHVVVTADGRVLTGIIKEETPQALTLQTANEIVVVPRGEVLKADLSDRSMMPDDLLAALSDAEVRALAAYLASPRQVPILATPENAAGFFNGRDLENWRGDPSLWRVENGEIVGSAPRGLDHNEFLKSEYLAGDFRLRLEVRLRPNEANSGIQFRSTELPGGDVRGYQADIGKGWWGKLYEEHGRGLLWDRSGEAYVRPEEWNAYEIVAVGSRIRTYINGRLCVDLDDPQGARRGIFALQIHSGGPTEVRFRNLHLEVLGADGKPIPPREAAGK